MVGIGFTEMIIIAGIALVVLGPEKFPEFAKIAIRALRDIRGYFDEVKTEISKEIKPIEKEINEITKKGNEVYREILTETDPSYTSKGYTPSTSYVENSYQTDYDKEEDNETSSSLEDTESTEPAKTNEGGSVEPYDPDIPHADLQKMATATDNNDEELHENNEDTELNDEDELTPPERLDG